MDPAFRSRWQCGVAATALLTTAWLALTPSAGAAHRQLRPRAGGPPIGRACRGQPPPPLHRLPRWQVVSPSAIRVHDGDTFSVGCERIRLLGVDTPELGRARSALATRRLAALLGAGPVTIVRHRRDVYGRTLAQVYVGGADVADVLRREGFQKR